MKQLRTYLVIKADGTMRLRTKRPSTSNLGVDEVAVPIVVHMPDGWGELVKDQIDIHMPDPPTVEPTTDPIIVGAPPEEPTDE